MPKEFIKSGATPRRAAIFMSGGGSNAEKLLESLRSGMAKSWTPSAIATDNPERSRAREIAAKNGVPIVELDIAAFYKARGLARVSIATPEARKVREEWTCELRRLLAPFKPDFGILAGFVPLSNIVGDFPCLNVHPGDLTVERDGVRILAGLHTIPIERAIFEGLTALRSSVIVAQPYTGAGSEMDSGPILGISAPVEADFMGFTLDELKRMAAERPASRPPGGFKDSLERIAAKNQDDLKAKGDWTVFPPVVEDFAAGRFALDDGGGLLWRADGICVPAKTVEYDSWQGRPIRR